MDREDQKGQKVRRRRWGGGQVRRIRKIKKVKRSEDGVGEEERSEARIGKIRSSGDKWLFDSIGNCTRQQVTRSEQVRRSEHLTPSWVMVGRRKGQRERLHYPHLATPIS